MLGDQTIQTRITHFYDEYSVLIYKYILKMTKDVQAAEDLTHDTFLKVYHYLMAEKEIDYPKTFIYRTAHNMTIDYIRKKKPLHILQDLLWNKPKTSPSTESLAEIREDSRELLDTINRMKTSYREVILLRKVEGLSVHETAEVLDWSEAKVRTTLTRAIRELEERLEKGGVLHEL